MTLGPKAMIYWSYPSKRAEFHLSPTSQGPKWARRWGQLTAYSKDETGPQLLIWEVTNSVGIILLLLPRNALYFHSLTRPKIQKQNSHVQKYKWKTLFPVAFTPDTIRPGGCGVNTRLRGGKCRELGGSGVNTSTDLDLCFELQNDF